MTQFEIGYEIFVRACDLPREARDAFVREACGSDMQLRAHVDSLLKLDQRTQLAMDQVDPGGIAHALVKEVRPPGAPADDGRWTVPARVGRYAILGELGRGGMGVVYEAEQEDPRRRVALKVVRQGFDAGQLVLRLRREAQVLAQLTHPGIAHIYESGMVAIDGREQPYFAMEFIAGERVTTYAGEQRLDNRQRLALMARVCDAVQHAHQKGIIHRDLKPANILVVPPETQEDACGAATGTGSQTIEPVGQPKILDFGVARLTDGDIHVTTLQTEVGQLIGTLAYMSPEQVAGDSQKIDTRSDVYALGVVLFELLTHQLPLDVSGRSVAEAARIIRDDEPPAAGAIDKSLRGDIETILAKALEKAPERRYASAAQLAGDIRRYLQDEPIVARPASALYQVRKFARRNSGLVAGLVATFAVLVIGLISTGYFLVEATRQRDEADLQRDEARRQARIAEEVNTFLQKDVLRSAKPEELGYRITVVEALDNAAEALEGRFEEEPIIRAEIHHTLTETYRSLGEHDKELYHAERMVALYRSELGAEHPDLAHAICDLAMALGVTGDYTAAEPLFREAMKMNRRLLDAKDPELASSLNSFATFMADRGDHAAAEQLFREALALRHGPLGEEHGDVASVLSNLASLLGPKEDRANAEPLYRRALVMQRRLLEEEHPEVATSVNDLTVLLGAVEGSAQLLFAKGRYTEAERLFRGVVDARRRLHGEEHVDVARSQLFLGRTLEVQGNYAAAETLYREALALNRKLLGDEHVEVAMNLGYLAHAVRGRGDYAAAEQLLRESLALCRKRLGNEHPYVASIMHDLADLLRQRDDYSEAEPLHREALAMRRKLLGNAHPDVAFSLSSLAFVLTAKGDHDEAEQCLREALGVHRKRYGDEHPEVATCMSNLAQVLQAKDDYAGAETLYRDALAMYRKLPGGAHLGVAACLNKLGALLHDRGDSVAAEPLLREALALVRKESGNEHPNVASCAMKLAQSLFGQRKFSEAEPLLRECLTIRQATMPPQHWLIFNTMSTLGECLVGQVADGSLNPTAGPDADLNDVLRKAEVLLLDGYEGLHEFADAIPPAYRMSPQRHALERVVRLYELWHSIEPGTGYDAQAAEWRAKAAEWNADTRPTSAPVR